MDEMIGHNNPPTLIETMQQVASDLSDWMKDHPVVSNGSEATEAKLLLDRSKLGIQDLEAERDGLVRPLNTQIKEINGKYKGPRELLEKVANELKYRVTDFLAKEEAKRIAAAEEARLGAERAEKAAKEAERLERERLDSAECGELDINVLDAIKDADRAFAAYQKAERQAQIAEREAGNVRLGGGFTRALSLRSTEILGVSDLIAAVTAMKDSERIVEAVIKAARSYKKVYGKYPPGIVVHTERRI